MKKIGVIILLLLFFCIPVRAEEIEEASNIDSIMEALPENAREIFEENGWQTDNIGEKLSEKGFFLVISDFLMEGFSAVIKSAAAIVSIILLSSLMNSFSTGDISGTVDTVCLLSGASFLTFSVYSCIKAAEQTLTAVFGFVTTAIPVYLGLLITGGKAATAQAGGVVLVACEVMSYICTFILSPVMNAYLAIGMCSAFADKQSINSLMDTIRKLSMWLYSFCVTVFLFIIGTKTAVGTFTDNLSMKTAKFVLGTAVPVAGNALSESATAVAASIGVLRSGAGIYIVAGAVIIVLPLICSLICWRFSLLFLKSFSDVFSCLKISSLMSSCEAVISLLLGLVLLSIALLIISMGVMMKV